ncbi:MAG: hypothetical protein WC205_15470 [Opitutaceae bacterium]|jgi:hypothetical protein
MKTSAPAAPRLADRYIRCDDFADRIDGIELAPEIWAVFAQLAKPRNAPELAEHLKLDIEAVNASIRRLVRRKLIRKHVLAWRDYTATTTAPFITSPAPAAVAEPAPAPVAAPVPAAAPKPVAPVIPAAPVIAQASLAAPVVPRPASPILSFRIASTSPARPAPVVSLRIGSPRVATNPAPVAAPISPETPGLKLRPVLDAIGAKAGGGVAGQLLVYRVFLQIPTALMHAAGLHSLSLVDDDYTLHHAELRSVLADTARKHAGIDIETLAAA